MRITFYDIPSKPLPTDRAPAVLLQLRRLAELVNRRFGSRTYDRKRLADFSVGLLVLARIAKQAGHECQYITWDDAKPADLTAAARGELLAISATTPFIDDAITAAEAFKHTHYGRKAILGGYHATALPRDTLAGCPSLDAVVIGEGELPFIALLQTSTSTWDRVPGVLTRTGGNLRPGAQLSPHQIDSPDYSLLPRPLSEYRINVQTVRGCRYRCLFCQNGYFWKTVRRRSHDSIRNEFTTLASTLPRGYQLHFTDNDFVGDSDHLDLVLEELQSFGDHFTYSCDVIATSVTPVKADRLAASGCRKVHIGFESSLDHVLKRNGKGFLRFGDNVRAAQLLASRGIMVYAYWIICLPGATANDVTRDRLEAARLLDEGVVHEIAPSLTLLPLPGTPLFDRASALGVHVQDRPWGDFFRSQRDPVYSTAALSHDHIVETYDRFIDMLTSAYRAQLGLSGPPTAVLTSAAEERLGW